MLEKTGEELKTGMSSKMFITWFVPLPSLMLVEFDRVQKSKKSMFPLSLLIREWEKKTHERC